MDLRGIESTLPPGFRFCPSDEELVCHYLQKKVANERVSEGTMVEVDLHTREPWELPEVAKLRENEWYFFSFRDRKYATGLRMNRATRSGYWKATGKDRTVHDPAAAHAVVGMRKTLVFYSGRAPNGTKTNWIMHEFRLETPHSPPKEDWVLCRVFHKKKGDPMSFSLEDNNNENMNGGFSSCNNLESQHHQQQQQIADGICYEQIMSSSFPIIAPHDHDGNNSNSSTFLDLAALHHNLFGNNNYSPQEAELDRARMTAVSSKVGGDDDYGFLTFDMALEGHDCSLGGGMDHNFGGMSFQGGVKDQFFF